MKQQPYRSLGTKFYQGESPYSLNAALDSFSNGEAKWEFEIWDSQQGKWVYKGNLQETIELILFGKLCKEQLEKEAKIDPIHTCHVLPIPGPVQWEGEDTCQACIQAKAKEVEFICSPVKMPDDEGV